MNWLANAAACAFALMIAAPAAAQAPVQLKFGVQTPEQVHYNRELFKPWAEKVQADSGGTIEIKFFFGGSLGKEGQLLEVLESGAADIVLDIAAYYPGRFPLSDIASLPLLVTEGTRSSSALWQAYEKRLLGTGFDTLKVLALSTPPAAALMTTKKTVLSPDDLSGLKISAGGAIKGKILNRFSAAPISTKVAELYQALNRGVVDGAISYYTALPPFKLHEVVKHYTDVPLGGSMMMVLMNKKKFDSLPEKAKAAIDKHSGAAFSRDFGALWDRQNEVGRKMARDAGGTIVTPDDKNQAAWRKGLQPVVDEWAKSVDGGAKLVEEFTKARDQAK
jgi:TRAP-type C4-dicarboxylate transport system substrate-binding protein